MAGKKPIVRGTIVPDKLLNLYVEQLQKEACTDFESDCYQRAWRVAVSDEEDGLLKITKAAVFFPYPKEEKGKIWRHYTALLLRQDEKNLLHYLNAGAAYWKGGRIVTCRLPLAAIVRMNFSKDIQITVYCGDSSQVFSLAKNIEVDDREMALLRQAGVIPGNQAGGAASGRQN